MILGICKSIGTKPPWLRHTVCQIQLKQIRGVINKKPNLVFLFIDTKSLV